MTSPLDHVLIIGASGFLGWQLVTHLASYKQVLPTHCTTPRFSYSIPYDFFKDDLANILREWEVSTVIFTALVENQPTLDLQPAFDRFLRACTAVRLVYLSSDGIFDGEKGSYTETAIPTPCTLYGQNLLYCEQQIMRHCANFCIIRPSYLYGFSEGHLDRRLSRTRHLLETGEDVVLFGDMYKSPLGVEQVAQAVIHLAFSDYIGVVHVAGERLSVFDFHRQAMQALGVGTRRLQAEAMPPVAGLLRDTSLSSRLWQTLTGMKPLSIQETLTGLLSTSISS